MPEVEKPPTKGSRTPNWHAIEAVSELIIAVFAVGGFLFSAYQSRQTAEVLATAADAFKAQAMPVVKFQRYQWHVRTGPPTCDQPALGMNVYYQNFSGVPVATEESKLELYMGDRPILQGTGEVNLDLPGERILAPGEATSHGFIDVNEFPAYFARLHGPSSSPHLKFHLTVGFRSLVSGKRYRYEATVVLLDDCSIPNQTQYQLGSEQLTELLEASGEK